MTTPEYRKGKNYTDTEREDRMQELDYHCEGCGKEIKTRRNNQNPRVKCLEGHHEIPVILGGNKNTRMRMLCGANGCHEIADRLVLGSRITFTEIVDILGDAPFERYTTKMKKEEMANIVANVIGRVRRGEFERGIMRVEGYRRKLRAS